MKRIPTVKELKLNLHYDKKTGIFTRLISNSPRVSIGDIAGSASHGYLTIMLNGTLYEAHRLAWLYEKGYWPENDIDHKDRIRHHNWIDNLREVSRMCNNRNVGNRKDNTSGIKGVGWHKIIKKWSVCMSLNNKKRHIGYYKSFDNAVCARLAAEQCVNWSGCDSSSPAYKYVKKLINLDTN